ncbi:MAG: GNAT family N-acetyltransferase [Solirubrobacterales bacterium]|nr:GNAT family N-acetyltransferase [Solirubrobacterales bacterium]
MPPPGQTPATNAELVRRVERLESDRERKLAERVEPRGRSAREPAEPAAETLGPYGLSRHAVVPLDPSEAARLERCLRFEQWHSRAAAERVLELDLGEALIDTRVPRVWFANYLWVSRPGVEAAELAAAGDEVLGGFEMEHRAAIVGPEADSEELGRGLEALGWRTDDILYMALDGPPPEPGAGVEAVELPHARIAEARRAVMDDEWWGGGDEVARDMLERDRLLDRAGGGRWFGAAHDGRVASYCVLYGADGVGQVESIGTAPDARRRGLARAAVGAATRASVARGDELTFITAEEGDWPKDFYARLGFRPIGRARSFTRPPHKSRS